jgi:hypothetical protein
MKRPPSRRGALPRRHLEAIGREVKHTKRFARKHAKRREFLM